MNEAYLAQAMDRHGDAVYRMALCRMQNIDDAEDVYQDTFLRLYQQSKAEDWEDEHLKAWLLRVAINLCNDIGRRRKRQGCISLEEIGELTAKDVYAYTELWEAIARLPEQQRMIFHLFYQEGYRTGEIAKIMQLGEGTVRVNLHRARNALRKELESNVSCV